MPPRDQPMTETDIAEALALWRRSPGIGLSGADTPTALAAFLRRNPGLSRVARDARRQDGRVVGTILAGHDGRRGLIHHLCVDPEWRSQGIGRALVEAALSALRAEGIDKVHLFVFDTNAPAHAFWARTGATRRDELQLYSITL